MFKVSLYPGFEQAFYECELCNEPVTNPICPSCLSKEIEIWSSNYPNLRREIIPKLKKYLKGMKKSLKESVKCIRCQDNDVPICPYCFIREVLDELELIDVNKQIKKEFLQFFNFDLGHTEYRV